MPFIHSKKTPVSKTFWEPKIFHPCRADRLKIARKLTGLTLEEIPEKFGISKHTFYAWESGRNPIRDKSIPKIINALRQVGVYCTSEWLMQGEGASPRFRNEIPIEENDSSEIIKKEIPEKIPSVYAEMAIFSEIKTFQKVNKNSEVKIITDDAMMPLYAPGEYVGGICFFREDIDKKALNTNCIVQMQDGSYHVRHLSKGELPGTYDLSALNCNSKVTKCVLSNVSILSAAPIIWHRKITP